MCSSLVEISHKGIHIVPDDYVWDIDVNVFQKNLVVVSACNIRIPGIPGLGIIGEFGVTSGEFGVGLYYG